MGKSVKMNIYLFLGHRMFTISQILSPLLPAVLVIGQSVAATRLRRNGILCVDL